MIWISFKPLLDFKLFFFKTWLPMKVRYMLFYKLECKAWMYRFNMVNICLYKNRSVRGGTSNEIELH